MRTSAPPDDPMATGPMLNRQAAAGALGVSAATVYRLVRSGELQAYRIGHQIRIAQVDLEDYVRAHPAPQTEDED